MLFLLLAVFAMFIIILFIILWVRFGLKLKSAGTQLGNNSLREAGNVIMFIFWFFVAAVMMLLLVGFILFGLGTSFANDVMNQITNMR